VRAVPINERYFGRWNDTVWLAFMAAGTLVVLISAANVANLMLGRTSRRAREIAIRSSLGAGRLRVVRQLLIEGCVLAAIGGAAGLGLAAAGLRLFRSAIPENALPYWVNYAPDARVIAALVTASLLTVLVFALLPAVYASRTSISGVLKDGGRSGTAGGGARRWTTAFLAAEFALAIVLMAQVAVSLRQLDPPRAAELGLTQGQLVTASLTLAGDRYRSPQQRLELVRILRERVGAIAGVSTTSVASAAPMLGRTEVRIEIAGRPAADAKEQPTAGSVAIGPSYFETLGVPLLRGRELADADGSAAVVVNEAFVEKFLADGHAIAQRLAVAPAAGSPQQPVWATIVGVAPTIPQRPGAQEPIVYTTYESAPAATLALLVRMRAASDRVGATLKDAVYAIDPDLPLYRVQSMNELIWQARWNGRISRQMIYALSLIAMALAVIGLYAVTMHAVAQRTQEIGVRMALGARPRQIVALVGRRASGQLGFGLAAGAICTRLWEGFIPSGDATIRATDPTTMALVAATLIVVSAAACIAPVRRAVRLDPVQAIRHE
jgi:putative ABC transport system permease protein